MRADQLLVARHFASTRSQAQRLIAGGVQWQKGAEWKRVVKNGDEVPDDAPIEWGEDTTPAPDAPRLWGSRRILLPLTEHARESPLHRTLQRHVERPRQHRRRPDHRREGPF